MKQVRILLTFIPILFLGVSVFAQKNNIGIGTTKPDQSAVLDISSTDKGLLMPRMSLQQRSGIQNPAQGLVIYQTDFLSGFYFYDGKEWKAMTSATNAKSVAGGDGDWIVGGNDLGPVAIGDRWIGVSSNHPLLFKTNNVQAGYVSSTGANTFFGYESGLNNTASGIFNTAIGAFALKANTTGSQNTAIGVNSLLANTTGVNNVSLGNEAMRANLTGFYNMAIGSFSLRDNISGQENVGVGLFTLAKNTTGRSSVAIGTNALSEITAGNFNVAIGNNSAATKTSGDENVAIGLNSLYGNLVGSENVAIGSKSLSNSTGSGNVGIGFSAGQNEITSNKLYIANSNTTLPLIYGDFSAKFISIGDVGVAGDPVATAAKRNSLATQYGLLVQKGILTEKIKVATMSTTDWADYVFENDYKRMPLEEVEQFVKENKHLPNVPTTTEMMASGSDLIKTDAKLLEKIEELTLYMIEMNKEIKALKAENLKLKK